MEKLATDIYTFANLIRDGFTYVVKTDRLCPLVNMSNRYADRFAGNGKTLTLIGLAFSKARRTIVAAKVEEVAR